MQIVTKAIIEPHYLPCLEYFCALLKFDEVILEKHEHFIKQTFRNRCYINTAHGPERLTVPLSGRHGKIPYKDVRIDHAKNWQNQQWRTLESAYRNAPYFEHFEGELSRILYTRFEFLFDLNLSLLSFCLQSLGVNPRLGETVTYEKACTPQTFDLRSLIIPGKPYSNRGFYCPQPYYQVFGRTFVPNLSVIDLLCCEGPNSKAILLASAGVVNK